MVRSFACATLLCAFATGAAYAAPFCVHDSPGFEMSFGLSIGEKYSDDDRNEFDLMHLRQAGVDATRVERWNGCIRAFVRKPGGGEEMQFFQPGSYQRVY